MNKLNNNQPSFANFLVNRPISEKFRVGPDKIPFGYIYCIENLKNGKKYIGSTYSVWVGVQNPRPMTALSKRASHYMYEYNKAVDNNKTTSTKKLYRPIIQAMIDDGVDNFIMYPIAETLKENHINAENYFIKFFDTINLGYNVAVATEARYTGRSLSEKEKLVRSLGIIAINMNDKKLIISDSMKLFGDYMNSSKDMIKNANRKGMPYKGWFVFYLDPVKRHDILINNVINDHDKRTQDRHSDNAKEFYKSLFTAVELYLKDPKSTEYFPGFEKLPDLKYDINK